MSMQSAIVDRFNKLKQTNSSYSEYPGSLRFSGVSHILYCDPRRLCRSCHVSGMRKNLWYPVEQETINFSCSTDSPRFSAYKPHEPSFLCVRSLQVPELLYLTARILFDHNGKNRRSLNRLVLSLSSLVKIFYISANDPTNS